MLFYDNKTFIVTYGVTKSEIYWNIFFHTNLIL